MACAAQPNCCTCPWGRACISGDMLRALPIVCVCAIALALPDRADPLLGNYWESPPLIGGHTGQVRRSTAARRAARRRRTARARRQAARPPHDPHTRCSRASSRASSTGACAIRDRQERLGRDAPTSRPGPCYTAPADTPRTSLCAPQRGLGSSLVLTIVVHPRHIKPTNFVHFLFFLKLTKNHKELPVLLTYLVRVRRRAVGRGPAHTGAGAQVEATIDSVSSVVCACAGPC